MSARRLARAAAAAATSGIPREVANPLHALWRDEQALRAHPAFAEFVDGPVVERLRLGSRVYHPVVHKWALDAGFESDKYPRAVDWPRLHAALTESENTT